MWACPHCQQALEANDTNGGLSCANGHQFDRAKEGYVNLLPANKKHSKEPGDNAEMIAARRLVHEEGLYESLAKGIRDVLSGLEPVEHMLDLGCGEGFYSSAMQQAHPDAQLYGIDIAKTAVRLAAKRYKGGQFAVASSAHLPLLNDSQDVVVRIFAPSDDAETLRVLKPEGYYLEVSPAPRHMWSLREALYDVPREHGEARDAVESMKLVQQTLVEYEVDLDKTQLGNLVAMTPFAHNGRRELRVELLRCPQKTVGMAFSLSLFQAQNLPARSWKYGRRPGAEDESSAEEERGAE